MPARKREDVERGKERGTTSARQKPPAEPALAKTAIQVAKATSAVAPASAPPRKRQVAALPEPSVPEAAAPVVAPPEEDAGDWRDHLRLLGQGLAHYAKHDLGRLVLYSVVGFLVGYMANALVMSMRYQGYANVPTGAPVVGQGNVAYASILWALGSAVFFGLISYRRAVGGKQFWADVRGFPSTIWGSVRADGNRAFVHALWGLGGAMLITQLLSPSLSVVLGAVLVVGLSRVFRPIITGLMMAAYRAIAKSLAPKSGLPPSVTMTVGIVGSIGAMAIGTFVPDQVTKLVFAALVVAAATGLSVMRRRALRPELAILLVGAALGVLAALRAHIAWAHDGGVNECVRYHFSCGAVGLFGQSIYGGTATGVGAGVGHGLGHAAARVPRNETRDQRRQRWWNQYHATHPGDPYSKFLEWYKQTPEGVRDMLDAWQSANRAWNPLYGDLLPTMANLHSDLTSGRTWERIKGMNAEEANTFFHDFDESVVQPLETAGHFWTHPSEWDWGQLDQPTRDTLQTSLDFWRSQGLDGIRQGVGELNNMTMDQWNALQGKMGELSDAVGRGDNAEAARIMGELAGHAQFQALMAKGPEAIASKVGDAADLWADAKRVEQHDVQKAVDDYWKKVSQAASKGDPIPAEPGPPPRSREEIMNMAQSQLADGNSAAAVKLTPEELEQFNVDKQTAMNMYETNLKYNQWDQLKVGDSTASGVRAAYGDDAYYKPNGEKFKGLTDYEQQKYKFSTLDGKPLDSEVGRTYHFKPPEEPTPGEPDYDKQKFRYDEYNKLDAQRQYLEQHGGERINSMGKVEKYQPKFEEVVGTDPATGKKFSAWRIVDQNGKASVTDMDSFARGNMPQSQYATGAQTPLADADRQRMLYQQSYGIIAGEGNTPAWQINRADYPQGLAGTQKYQLDLAAKADTIRKAGVEGVIEVRPDGFYLVKGTLHP